MKMYANLLLRSSNFQCDALMGYDTKHSCEFVNRKTSLRIFLLLVNISWLHNLFTFKMSQEGSYL